MGSHLYAGLTGRVSWFARRFGWSELLLKPLRVVFAPVIRPVLRPESFTWRGKQFSCFYHRYNMTWCGERMIEVPIGESLVTGASGGRVLEVGNVLSHYFPSRHTIIDKYEISPGVINTDIIEYNPAERFDLILSISTFEHIGFDDDAPGSSGEKILACVRHCQSLLTDKGRLFLTFPTGYNPDLDRLLADGSLSPVSLDCFWRQGPRKWVSCDLAEAAKHPYRSRYPYANGLILAEFSRKDRAHP